MPGPMRKRDSERRRRNKDGVETLVVDLETSVKGKIEIPAPPMKYVDADGEELEEPKHLWHPIVEEAYLSLSRSGQAVFYEPSDWATAYLLCEAFSRELKPKPLVITDSEGNQEIQMVFQPVNGAVMNAFLKGWGELMATEGGRRKLRIELDRAAHRDAQITGDASVLPISKKRNERFAASKEA